MKQLILIVLIILGLIKVETLTDQNIVIGVYTQKYFYGDHNSTTMGRVLTYLGPNYVNIGTMASAKVVPIYSYVTKDDILSQLSKVNGIIFTGG